MCDIVILPPVLLRMSTTTLLGALSQGSISNPLTGVKRPLAGNPTSLPTQFPAFRGQKNTPGSAIKAPRIQAGNRVDRGTNVTVPYARVTELTSIAYTNGRLSPGDVAFVSRNSSGYTGASRGKVELGSGNHMTDMFGIDGVNRMLAGTLNGQAAFKVGYNTLDVSNAGSNIDGKDVFDIAKEKLNVLWHHRPDGVIMSNEEPHSFAPTGNRDATVFNIAIRGPAATNNGYLNYDTHSAVELYARQHDVNAGIETMRIGLERAADTWHNKVGYDFVAAYTGSYSEYPLQMFDRKAQTLNKVYLLLRKYNVYDDVILNAAKGNVVNTQAIFARMDVRDENGNAITDINKTKDLVFFQYMPCSSRAFTQYTGTRDKIDATLLPGLAERARKQRYNKNSLSQPDFDELHAKRLEVYKEMLKNGELQVDRMDAVRYEDIHHAAGAWQIGTIVDSKAAKAGSFASGPSSTGYRMTVNVSLKWMPRNKTIEIGLRDTKTIEEAAKLVQSDVYLSLRSKMKMKYALRTRDNTNVKHLGLYRSNTLAAVLGEPVRNGAAGSSTQPQATQPQATQPQATQPQATQPQATQPPATQPQATQPPATQPQATQPQATQPPATQPPATQPQATQQPTQTPAASNSIASKSVKAAPAALAATASKPASKAIGKQTVKAGQSSMVNATIEAAQRKAAANGAKSKPTGVVDSVFDSIFGSASPTKAAPPSSPTPSSDGESGPMSFQRSFGR